MSLQQFLSDIGANDLSPRVDGQLGRLHKRIRDEVDETKSQIHKTIKTNLPDYERQLATGQRLTQHLSGVNAKVDQLETALHAPQDGLVSTVTSTLSAHAEIAQKAAQQAALVQALSSLKSAHVALAKAESLLQSGQLDQVVGLWQETENAVRGPAVEDWIRETHYWQSAAQWLEELQKQTKDRLHAAADACIQVSSAGITIASETSVSPSTTQTIPLPAILSSLSPLALLEPYLLQLTVKLMKTYMAPYLSGSHSFEADSSILTLTSQPESSTLSTIPVLTTYLKHHIPQLIPYLAPPLLQSIITSTLLPVLPPSTDLTALETFYSLLGRTKSFETTLNQSIIATWEKNLSSHWLNKVNNDVFSKVRAIVGDKTWEGKLVGFKPIKLGWFPSDEIEASPVLVQKSLVTEEAEVEEDGWDLDEDVLSEKTSDKAVSEKAPSEATMDADEWGLDEEIVEAADKGKQKAEDQDGWGFEEEIPVSPMPDQSQAEFQAASNFSHSQEPSWEWEAEAEEVRSKGHARTRSRGKRKEASPPAVTVEPEAPEENFMVSTNTDKLADLAQNILKQLKHLRSADFPYNDLIKAFTRLSRTFLDTFDYYRATMPVQHASMIGQVPALGIQFANDCDSLAARAAEIIAGSSDQFLKQDAQPTVAGLTVLAAKERVRQIESQRAILMESLDDANGFRDTADPATYARCERSIKQIHHSLERLAKVWAPIMTRTQYLTLFGDLINSILSRILREIEDHLDIGEEESKQLNQLCKMLHDLDSLFAQGDNNPCGIFVPTWFKFVFFSEILEASMIDLMYLLDEGHLSDFSSEELVKLVKALFSDSPTRQKNIDKIRSANIAT